MMRGIRFRNGISMVVAACCCIGLVSGCGPKDTGTVVNETAEDIQKRQAENIEKVKNDPNIPAAQKQAILARMQAGTESGKAAEARNAAASQGGGGGTK